MYKLTALILLATLAHLCLTKRNSNQKFKACCARQKTADRDCKRRFCDFNSINQDNMLHFLNTCSPREDTVKLMWDCASSRQDHTDCCKKSNVSPACLAYCETTSRVPTDYLNHLFCLRNFNSIRNCFQQHLDTHPNIFGDQ